MHAVAVPSMPAVGRRRSFGRPRIPRRRAFAVLLVVALALLASTAGSTIAYLRLPEPTGAFAVGRADVLLTDPDRIEPRSQNGDRRAVRVIAWYPATAGTGRPADYVPGFATLRDGLEASGELDPIVLAGVGSVTPRARADATPVVTPGRLPVVLLSPGNATNVAFYGALAEDLASHGYVVLGIDHPYQVAAVDLGGQLAVYAGDAGGSGSDPAAGVAGRIDERLADLTLVLDRLEEGIGLGLDGLDGRLDAGRIAVVGHSNGGLAAAQACRHDPRVAACVNIDGQALGGPFSARLDHAPLDRPFLFLTKETRLHEAFRPVFEASPGAVRVVVPAATHQQFTDGPRLAPRVAPLDGTADAVLAVERAFVRAFVDAALAGGGGQPFTGLPAPTDVYVEVFPLGDRPALPTVPG